MKRQPQTAIPLYERVKQQGGECEKLFFYIPKRKNTWIIAEEFGEREEIEKE